MTFRNIFLLIIISASLLLMTISCSTLEAYHRPPKIIKPGPPAHAPAHGYRHKQVAGMELVFDSALGLYVVVGFPNHYYHNGHFYRLRGTLWEVSLKPKVGWTLVSDKSLPPGLQAHVKHNVNTKAISKAQGKGKYKRARK